jgi:hypothetical protein
MPRPTHTPPAEAAPDGADEAAGLLATAWTAVAGAAEADWAGPDQAQWPALADTLAAQWRIVTGPDPLARAEGEGLPGTPTAAPAAADAAAQADQALARLAEAAWGRAAAEGATAAWWAGLAGSAEQLRRGLTGPYAAARPADPLVLLAVLPEDDAFARLADASHGAVYTASTLLGWLPADDGRRADVVGMLNRFRAGRDDLAAAAALDGWDFLAAAVAYAVPPLTDEAGPLTLLDQASAAWAEAAVAWLAAAPDERRGQALAAVRWAAGLGQGYVTAVWFGWPD